MTRLKVVTNTTNVGHLVSIKCPVNGEEHLTTNKIKLLAGLLTLITPIAAFAAPPIAYDGWTVTNGTIDTSLSCGGVGVSCRELVPAEAGFKYEEVVSDGSSFFRLILTEADATGDPTTTALDFANESYVPFAIENEGIAQGIASKLAIRDSASNLEIVAEVQTGNMRSLYTTTAEELFTTKLSQTLSPSADFNSAFSFTNYTAFSTNPASQNPDTGTEIGRRLTLSQNTLIGLPGDTTKKQTFVQSQVSGFAGNTVSSPWGGSPPGLNPKFLVNGTTYFIGSPLSTAGSMTLPDTANGRMVSPATTSTVGWAATNDISTTWVAQSSNSPLNPNGVDINFQRVKNNTTGIEASATLLELIPPSADPFAWDPNFGAAPPSL